MFLSRTWLPIGNRQTLAWIISEINSIDFDMLQVKRSLDPNSHNSVHSLLESKSLSKCILWAVHRQTTRLEDQAYCLMGLFNINMPLLYGEGLEKHSFGCKLEYFSSLLTKPFWRGLKQAHDRNTASAGLQPNQ